MQRLHVRLCNAFFTHTNEYGHGLNSSYSYHPRQDLEHRLTVAKTKAERADETIDIATSPITYNRAIESLSSAISECVGPKGLLPKAAGVTIAARAVEKRMRRKLKGFVKDMKHELSKSISTARQTGESGPLSAYLTKLKDHGECLRKWCNKLFRIAETLLKRLQVRPC